MPRSRASEARWDVEPPSSVTTPATRARHLTERGTGHLRDEDVSETHARKFAFAAHDDAAARAPPNSGGMAAQARMPKPDLIGRGSGLDTQRPRLQKLRAMLVKRPLDLDRAAADALRLEQHHAERLGLLEADARLAGKAFETALGATPRPCTHTSLCGFGQDRSKARGHSDRALRGLEPPRPARARSLVPRSRK